MGTFLLYTLTVMFSWLLAMSASQNYKYGNPKKAIKRIWLIVLILSIVAGLRDTSVGTDTYSYSQMFLNYGNHKHLEVGFRALVKFLMTIYYNPTFVFLILALLINGFIVFALWRYREYVKFEISVLLFAVLVYFLTFSGVRQYLAVAVCFYFSTFLIKGEVKGYFIYGLACLLMTTIHTSALAGLLLIPAFFVATIKVNRSITMTQMVLFIVGVIGLVGGFGIVYSKVIDAYGKYFDTQYSNASSLGYMVFFKLFLIIVVIYCNTKSKSKFDKKTDQVIDYRVKQERIIVSMSIIVDVVYQGVCFVGYYYSNISRIGWYFIMFEVLLYSKILEKFKEKRFFLLGLMVLVVVFYSYYVMFASDGNHIIPYSISSII